VLKKTINVGCDKRGRGATGLTPLLGEGTTRKRIKLGKEERFDKKRGSRGRKGGEMGLAIVW